MPLRQGPQNVAQKSINKALPAWALMILRKISVAGPSGKAYVLSFCSGKAWAYKRSASASMNGWLISCFSLSNRLRAPSLSNCFKSKGRLRKAMICETNGTYPTMVSNRPDFSLWFSKNWFILIIFSSSAFWFSSIDTETSFITTFSFR